MSALPAGPSAPGPRLAGGAVVVADGELLMVRRGHGPGAGTWSVPGGHVELGETLAEAVVRELAEETGLDGLCGPFVAGMPSDLPNLDLIILQNNF